MEIALDRYSLAPGSQLTFKDVSWGMYERILEEWGDGCAARIHYSQGWLEIMVPLPEHEDDKVLISNLVEILLEELDIEFRNLGSTTFKSQEMDRGVEADSCFYIENEPRIRGKKRIDLAVDPPPDLAIEIDITQRTRFNNYEVLGVGELWRFNGQILEISILQGGKYVRSPSSPHFPNLPVIRILPEYLERSKTEGRNTTMRAFRKWVREQIDSPSA